MHVHNINTGDKIQNVGNYANANNHIYKNVSVFILHLNAHMVIKNMQDLIKLSYGIELI